MGTNFYLRKRLHAYDKYDINKLLDEDKYDEISNILKKTERIHIGKRSAGWKFLWDANNFEYFKPNIDSLKKFLKSGIIVDEYERTYTFDQFWNDELYGFIDGKKLYDAKSYYENNEVLYKVYVSDKDIARFAEDFNIKVNPFGEFYVDNLRFTTDTDFS